MKVSLSMVNPLSRALGLLSLSSGDDLVRSIAEQLDNMERLIMIDLDQILSEVQSQSSMITELSTIVAELHKQITEQANGNIVAPATQAKIDALMVSAVANKTALAQAMQLASAAIKTTAAMKNPNLA